MDRSRLLPWLVLALPLAVLWGPALVTDTSLALRDAAHFYHPLYQWCAAEWGAGRIPLWNPQENLGMPVLADASSSVFYPGKLLFALPLDFALRYKLYVLGHELWAAAGAFYLARSWRRSRPAATVAALSYALAGPILFQYSNVVFLVGAAWLPWALVAAERIRAQGSGAATLGLAVVLALILLGGDPQMALHAAVLAGLWAVFGSVESREEPHAGSEAWGGGPLAGGDARACAAWRPRLVRLGQVAAAGAWAGALAAVQVLPSSEATRLSERAAFNRPRTVYEAAYVALSGKVVPAGETPAAAILRGLFGPPERGSHHELAFDFSIGPWRLLELGLPNVGGRMFPTHRRWFSLLPAEGRIWTPTLYLGLLPIVLAVRQVRLRRGAGGEVWLSWTALLFLLGSFGYYGLGWLLQTLVPWRGPNGEAAWGLGPQVGGVYWLLVTLVPTYIYFRYPAKLLTVAVLAASQLAARGWDAEAARPSAGLVRLLQGWGSAMAGVALMVWLIGPGLLSGVRHRDASVGPFDPQGACQDVLWAFGQSAAVALAAAWMYRQWAGGLAGPWPAGLLILTGGDLTLAHRGLVATAPAALWRDRSPVTLAIAQDRQHAASAAAAWAVAAAPGHDMPASLDEGSLASADATARLPARYWRGSLAAWRPAAFRQTRSRHRQAELVAWEAATLFPKYHLAQGLSLVESYGSIKLVDQESFFFVAKQHGPPQPGGSPLPQPTALRLLSTDYLVLPEGANPSFARRIAPAEPSPLPAEPPGASQGPAATAPGAGLPQTPSAWPADTGLWRMGWTLPRAWVVHQVEVLPPLKPPYRIAEVDERTREVLFPGRRARDFSRVAVIETETPPQAAAPHSPAAADQAPPAPPDRPERTSRCEITSYAPHQVTMAVDLVRPGLLVLSEAYYPGWRAWRHTGRGLEELPVYRTNRIVRGVWLPAGRHEVWWRYEPASFRRGAVISLTAWLLVAGAAGALRLGRRRAARLSRPAAQME